MTNENKAALLEIRLNCLETNKKDNAGVCRKIRRNIRNLKKKGN